MPSSFYHSHQHFPSHAAHHAVQALEAIAPMDAKLEFLELLGYDGSCILHDDSSLSEEGYFLDDDTLKSLSDHKVAQSNVRITDLNCGQFRASSPFSAMNGADSQHMSQSRRTKNHVCHPCMTRPSSLHQRRRLHDPVRIAHLSLRVSVAFKRYVIAAIYPVPLALSAWHSWWDAATVRYLACIRSFIHC